MTETSKTKTNIEDTYIFTGGTDSSADPSSVYAYGSFVAGKSTALGNCRSLLGQIKTSRPLSGEFDLRSPLYVTLSLYQDYEWTIVAEQPIERAFTVAGQIGATVIDAQKRTATAYVPKGTNLGDITVTRLKLGPADITTYSPTAEELSASGFETMRFVDATYHGATERWTLHVEHTDLKIAFRETDLWNNTGVITAMATEEEYPDAVIQYLSLIHISEPRDS